MWRHALINYPHPLLKRGLVVLDTPGLNAIGAEPELTLSLLPTAHATVFILGADTGVTKSDLAIWRDHLSGHARTRFVVLNKIDALFDPLTPPAHRVRADRAAAPAHCAHARRSAPTACFRSRRGRHLPRASADDDEGVDREPPARARGGARRRSCCRSAGRCSKKSSSTACTRLEAHVMRSLGDRRRQIAEQMLELRGLRGKSSAKVHTMLQRVDAETAEFEQCTARLQAMRIGAQPHAERRAGRSVERATARRGRRDAARDERDAAEPRREEGLRSAVRAAARADRARASARRRDPARCWQRRSTS